jgi:hypothetical protein
MNPFVPMLMFPQQAKAAYLQANIAQDIPIPSGAKYVMLRGTDNYWVGITGNAFVPIASVGLTDDLVAPVLRPDGIIWYCEEMQSLSVISDVALCIVSALFYAQQ